MRDGLASTVSFLRITSTYRKYSENDIGPDSPIIKLQVLGTPMYVLNDLETAVDLFVKRASNYSQRYIHATCYFLPAHF